MIEEEFAKQGIEIERIDINKRGIVGKLDQCLLNLYSHRNKYLKLIKENVIQAMIFAITIDSSIGVLVGKRSIAIPYALMLTLLLATIILPNHLRKVRNIEMVERIGEFLIWCMLIMGAVSTSRFTDVSRALVVKIVIAWGVVWLLVMFANMIREPKSEPLPFSDRILVMQKRTPMARNESHSVTTSEGVQAWRDDRTDLSTGELSALTREGAVLNDRNAGVYLRVVEGSTECGPESERSVSFEDDSGQRVEYQLDRVRDEIISGEIEPVPKRVSENAAGIAREIASYELGELDTLSRDEPYTVVEYTETLADAKNAVQLAGISRFGEGDGE